MTKTKSSRSKKTQPEKYNYHPDQFAGTFDLSFLKPQSRAMSYEDELLTAEEKAAYYEDRVQNNGERNFEKMAKVCQKKADALKRKVAHLDPDEARPLLDKIAGLESLAEDYGDPTPPDVLASQTSPKSGTTFPLSHKQEEVLNELGLLGFPKLAQLGQGLHRDGHAAALGRVWPAPLADIFTSAASADISIH